MVYQLNNVWMATMKDFINTEVQFMVNNKQTNHFYCKLIRSKESKKYYVQLIFSDESNNTITMTSLPLYPKRKAEMFYGNLLQSSKLIKGI